MNRQEILKGFFGITLLLGLSLGVMATLFRLNALPNLAKILPEDGTVGFVMMDKFAAPSILTDKIPQTAEPWVDKVGWAKVGDSTATFLEVNSSQDAENYLVSLKVEGEILTSSRATRSLWSSVTCYPLSKNPCATWIGDVLVLSDDEALLETLQKVVANELPSLQENPSYQNLDSRLASWNGGSAYVDLSKILTPPFNFFPAIGASMKVSSNLWSVESFLSVDKNLIHGASYWHPTEKYEAHFLPWTPGTLAVEWGGRDAGAQIEQMQALVPMHEVLDSELQKLFGSDTDFTKDLAPLLTGEQYFAFTSGTDFLFLTQLDSSEEIQKALDLKDHFGATYQFLKTFTTESGEVQGRLTPLTQTTGQYQNYQYYHFTAEDEEVATVLVTEDTAIVAGKQQTAFDALDRMQGRTAPRPLDSFDSLLPGATELWALHCHLLPDGSILGSLLAGFDTFTATRKIFDDGVFTRSTLTVTHD